MGAKRLYGGEKGITPSYLPEHELISYAISKFYFTPIELIARVIPAKRGITVKNCYRLLMLVQAVPGTTAGYLIERGSMARLTVNGSLAYLVEMGFVKKVGKPRLIIPFGRYKVETGYSITVAGVQALRKILEQ